MVAKKDSATALSQHSPFLPTESKTPFWPGEIGEVPTRILTASVANER